MAKRAPKNTAKDKLAELKAKHFTPEGRKERIARALEILNSPGPSFKADRETWIWAAQEADIEDI
jgi:predicted nucleic acid-binding protein